MELEIPTDEKAIVILPADEIEEIAQNVRTILLTPKFSVPLDRGFGIDGGLIDLPMSVAKVRLTANIVEAVNKFEPRVKVKKINFSGDSVDGVVVSSVIVELVESKLRGGVAL